MVAREAGRRVNPWHAMVVAMKMIADVPGPMRAFQGIGGVLAVFDALLDLLLPPGTAPVILD